MEVQGVAIRATLNLLQAQLSRKTEALTRLSRCKKILNVKLDDFKSQKYLCHKPALSAHTWLGRRADEFLRIQQEGIQTAYINMEQYQFRQILDDLAAKISELEQEIHGLEHRIGTLEGQMRCLKS
ncbi:DUF5082 family protein [Camelliibacillus cellulosilyticus]|uniref:DUF5082 family protein n=1 Tax=Camelliibacillus cellulosilyticus TaxID=2174486 RepID=A0ABV9GNL0_9BACL